MAPIALRIKISQPQLLSKTKLDLRDMRSDLARNELKAAALTLMVKENSTCSIQAIRLTVIAGELKAGHLRDAVSRAWMKRRLLVLRAYLRLPKHLARACEIKSCPGRH